MGLHLVGGISSAGRAVPPLDGRPLLIDRAEGPWLWDRDGRRYVDTALGFGATILGHGPEPVIDATTAAIRSGSMPAFAHAGEEAAASALAALTAPLTSVVFTSTGSEAVHLAARIARVATGRGLVAKMAAGYDGWYDDVTLGQAGSAEALMRANSRPRRGGTLLLRYNDFEDVERLFAESDDIAAVLIEPMLANAGCVPAAPGYLAHVAAVARRHGALVISDEVLMGFRLRAGLTAPAEGVEPDLATVGKAIGSGFAVAAVVGRPDVMRAAEGAGVRAGTYSGNPVATAAVLATLAELKAADYPALLARGDRLRAAIVAAFAAIGRSVSTSGFGTVFTLWFADRAPTTYAEAAAIADAELTRRWHLALRRRGALVMPFPFGRLYLSFSHDEPVCAELASVVAASAGDLDGA
ncbi:MAG: aminotransferase class III-fold pyridoxal phosphate-dependent enzyme [Amaricoccus sp.]|uniref:aminotransferase class III-fold pyridoxal phosphate-dependent enzyme n=1 Tax=Amaricoccus sp. TaxID=1872485 RepID=UPI0039E2E6BA